MAIFFDDKYCKIARTVNNFIDQTTEIEMNVYKSKETREREKKLKYHTIHTPFPKMNKILNSNINT